MESCEGARERKGAIDPSSSAIDLSSVAIDPGSAAIDLSSVAIDPGSAAIDPSTRIAPTYPF